MGKIKGAKHMLPLERKKLSKTDATVFFIHFLNPYSL
jgi:hypothetical protein